MFGFSTSHITDLTDFEAYKNRLGGLALAIKKRHIDEEIKTRRNPDITSNVLDMLAVTIREEENDIIEIPSNEIHLIEIQKGIARTLKTKYAVYETPFIIGRDEQVPNLVIRDQSVSRNHCDLIYTKQGMFIRDLQSTNGTYVDGERVQGKQLLSDGSLITFAPGGDVVLSYFCGINTK